jgi:bifunctional non-homologous end joining protein LigD
MSNFVLPSAATAATLPREVRLQVVSASAEPPQGSDWLHEIKHDGHRLLAIVAGDSLQLISRNGHDRTTLFHEPFRPLAAAGLPPLVLDGEIAVPDERGVTHIDALNEAISARRFERLAYFAFDLLHLDGHDLRRCRLEDRKALLRDLIGAARCERIVYVDHLVGLGRELLEAVRQIGAEGVVSKRAGSAYRDGVRRDWLKTKYHQVGQFVVTGFVEEGGRLEALQVAELHAGELVPAGLVQFGLAGKGLWPALDQLRAGSAERGVIPLRMPLQATGQALRADRRALRARWRADGVECLRPCFENMRRFLWSHSLSIALGLWVGLSILSFLLPEGSLQGYVQNLAGDAFGAAVIVVATKFFIERGSPESKE